MSLSRRVGSGAILQLTARLGSAFVSFAITAVVLARVLDPAEYGRFHFWLTTFMLTLALQDLGVNRAAIRRVSAQEAALEPTIRSALKLKSWIGCGAFVILAAVALFAEDSLTATLWIVAASTHVLTHGLAAGSIPFEVAVDFKTPAIGVLLAALVFLLGGSALAIGGVRNADPYLVAYGAGLVAQNLWLWRARRCRSDSLRSRLPSTTTPTRCCCVHCAEKRMSRVTRWRTG